MDSSFKNKFVFILVEFRLYANFRITWGHELTIKLVGCTKSGADPINTGEGGQLPPVDFEK
jgi:hypothetical protein